MTMPINIVKDINAITGAALNAVHNVMANQTISIAGKLLIHSLLDDRAGNITASAGQRVLS